MKSPDEFRPMKRHRRTVRVFTPMDDGTYVDRTVISIIGGDKPRVVIREVVHGVYKCVGMLSGEAVEDGIKPPRHSRVFLNPSDWTYRYLQRIG